MWVPAFVIVAAAATATPVAQAERLAAEATALAATDPLRAQAVARQALAKTEEFEPTAFVRAGRRGEVVEDEFQAAREAYRAHRGQLFEAMGRALAAGGNKEAAARYLRRAFLLQPTPDRLAALARALLAVGRAPEALALLQSQTGRGGPPTSIIPIFEQAVDAAELPSAQVEIDRARLNTLTPRPAEVREGLIKLPPAARLSTGAPLKLEAAPTLFYLASRACRTCSEDLEVLKAAAGDVRVLMVPEDPDDDHPLRQVLQLYRHRWPVALGSGMAGALGVPPGSLLVVGRGGWLAVAVKPPFSPTLEGVLATLARNDVAETVPRKGWNLRPPDRRPPTPPPALHPSGLAPGDDEPAPDEFTRAGRALEERHPAEALRLIDALAAREDQWLLPPEVRYDRALILSRLGRRDEARRLLLRIGDSRFQEAVDRAMESAGSRRPR